MHFAWAYSVEDNEELRAKCEHAEATKEQKRMLLEEVNGNLRTLILFIATLENAFTICARQTEAPALANWICSSCKGFALTVYLYSYIVDVSCKY